MHSTKEQPYILAINPGSTSTKVALFSGEKELFSHTAEHSKAELKRFSSTNAQLPLRRQTIMDALAQHGHATTPCTGVVGRGGLLAPMRGGAWWVNDTMLQDLRTTRYGDHPCNLGAPLAHEFAAAHTVQAIIVDPVVTVQKKCFPCPFPKGSSTAGSKPAWYNV